MYTMPPVFFICENVILHFGSWLGCMSSSVSVTGVGVESFVGRIYFAFGPGGHGIGQLLIELLDGLC